MYRYLLGGSLIALLGTGCSGAKPAAETVVDGRAIASEDQGGNWLSVGPTYAEQHYSPLSAIKVENVKDLGLAWFLDLPGQRGLQATPLAVDGTLYFSGTSGWVFAVDARRGTLLWKFDPDLTHNPPQRDGVIYSSNRGVAFWKGKVYVGTVDGRLMALEAKTGRVVWSVQTFDDADQLKSISGAPRAFNGKVIIGHGGEKGTRGYVTAYDAETGKKVWRFYTVPGDPAKGFENAAMEMAAKTWSGQWWKQGGNGTVWNDIAYDPDLNRIYIGTANATPLDPNERGPGDNLFVASIVALDAETGEYRWHYQVNPGEAWDYDAATPMVQAELTIGGQRRRVLLQASRNGFFYVIDRDAGKLLSAEKIGKVTWADRIDLTTGRPVEAPGARYEKAPVTLWPSMLGIHNWQPMAFHPGTGLIYIPTLELGMYIGRDTTDFSPREPGDGSGGLLAWDPVTQTKRWEVKYPDAGWNSGVLTTAGNLVFHGTGRGQFHAYDVRTGARLWSFDAGLGINAAPMSYSVDGTQYVAVLVGYGGTANAGPVFDYGWRFNEQPRRLLAFAVGQHVALPAGKPPRLDLKAVDDPAFVIDPKKAALGAKVYAHNCVWCHGFRLENFASIAPDLRESRVALDWNGFRAVLHDGTLASLGMPKYDNLSDDELRAVQMYVRLVAREAASPPAKGPAR